MSVIGLSDSGTKSPINVTLSQLKAEFNFDTSGQINFKQFTFDLGAFEIQLNSYIYRAVFWLLKGFVASAIKGQEAAMKTALVTMVDNFVTKPAIVDIGFGIGFNLTNIDRPKLDFYPGSIKRPTITHEVNALQFLSDSKNVKQASNQTSTISFGVHASMYPNMDPTIKPNILPAPKMSFNLADSLNDFSILLSDYTLNTILFMVQQSSFM